MKNEIALHSESPMTEIFQNKNNNRYLNQKICGKRNSFAY